MSNPLKPLTLPFLAFILIALVGVFVVTAPPAAAQRSVPPVTNIDLRNGPNSGEVIVSWDAVPSATHYRIGYVNMEVDYYLAKASCTEEWIEAFIYVDVNARNIPINNGRAEYTIRRLSPGARHAFTVLTSGNFVDSGGGGSVRSEFFWPSNPRWKFLTGRDTLPSGITLPTGECSAATTPGASSRPVTNIDLRNGSNSGEVIVSWDAVSSATHYRIGYVNMEVDYYLAKASCTEEWIEAFIYVDVNARNIPISNGRAEYTIRRLSPGARHAFTVLTSGNFVDSGGGGSVRSEFFWPSNPRWKFLAGRDALPSGITLPTGECSTPTVPTVSNTLLSLAEMERRVRSALVQIIVINPDGTGSAGSGFIVRSDGTAVTNRHVVDGHDTVTVRMHPLNGPAQTFTGRVLGRAILPDLAVIRLDGGLAFSGLPLGDSDNLPAGTEVSAWGFPGARISRQPTRTDGNISSRGIRQDARYLQTDAAINPGNSGGPLVDGYGNVVGVNTSKIVEERVDNVGFAVASSEVSDRLDTLVNGGPTSATYHNLAFDYGYSMNIPKGWYLDVEIPSVTNFRPYGGDSVSYIQSFTFRRPNDRSSDLVLLTDFHWDERLPTWAEDWVRFEKISKRKVTIRGQEFYRLEYRRQDTSTSCVQYQVDLVSVSSSYPNKPIGFVAGNGTCEENLSTYRAERNTMLNSFRP